MVCALAQQGKTQRAQFAQQQFTRIEAKCGIAYERCIQHNAVKYNVFHTVLQVFNYLILFIIAIDFTNELIKRNTPATIKR
jgi:hypothetical protein